MSETIDELIARARRARQGFSSTKTAAPVKVPAAVPASAPAPRRYGNDDEYVPVGVNGLLAASEKLLAINRGLEQPDHREGLAYKHVMTPDRILRERIAMDETGALKKVLRMAARQRSLKPLTAFGLDDYATRMLLGSPLVSPIEEINPMQHAEFARRMTLMGPGGIGSRDALTPEMQNVSADQFGFIDTLAGPESEMAGIDTRLAWGVRVGSDGRLYQQFRNRRTGELEWLSPADLQGKVIKLPD